MTVYFELVLKDLLTSAFYLVKVENVIIKYLVILYHTLLEASKSLKTENQCNLRNGCHDVKGESFGVTLFYSLPSASYANPMPVSLFLS